MSFQKELDKMNKDKLNRIITVNLDVYMCKTISEMLKAWYEEADEQFELDDFIKEEVPSICKALDEKVNTFLNLDEKNEEIDTVEYNEQLFARIGKILRYLWT
ncbi:hypothetical protein [Cetobacterium sp.]|uniref:hypothetical protein n=1 Tax=Cetobacterium sp. TaxID=2071632 RepID=UPI003F3787FA